jgi:hypothetical protein
MKSLDQMTDEELDQAILAQASAQPEEIDFSALSDDDLDNMLAEKLSADAGPRSRPGEAFAQSFGDAASFGYLPHLQAAVEPVADKISSFFGDGVDEQLKEQGFVIDQGPEESYVQRRDKFIRRGQKLAEENPEAAMAGGVSGAITSGVATGGGLSKLLGSAAKTATTGKRFVDAGKTGAFIGAARNPGDIEGELGGLQIKDRAQNALKDAATGLVVQGGLEGVKKVGEGVKNAGKNLKTYSQNKALKASGAMLKDFRKAVGKKKAGELGQTAIDEDLVSMGDDIADTAKKAESKVKESGKKIGEIYDKADNVASLNSSDLRGLQNDFIEESSKRLDGTIDADEVAQKIDKVLSVLHGQKNPTFGQLRKLRASIDDKINFAKETKDLPAYQEELLHLRNKVNDLVQSKIGSTNQALKKELLKENKRFSNLAEISKMSKDKMAREESNAAFGLRERISGGVGATVGAMIGGPVGAGVGAVTGAITTKVARKYGTPFVAMTANKAARALEKNQEALGKFSKPLIDAAKDPKKYVATINLMLKDPEFKKSIKELDRSYPIYRGPAKGERK